MNPTFFPDETLLKARSLFPHIAQGRIYLNHAATSPLSTRVVEAVSTHLANRSSGAIDDYWTTLERITELRKNIATLINAESPARIAFTGSTTEAINIVAAGLDWQPGDRVLLNDMEFPANVYPYLHLQKRGVEIDTVPSEGNRITADMIERFLKPQTRVVALSAVQFLTGFKADLQAIGEICRSRNIVFAVDAIQAVGAVKIDVQAMKIDALAAGAQKWQMSPHGSGFLYVTEELQCKIQQQHLGWLSVENPWNFFDFSQPLDPTARRYENGSLIMPSLWGMHAAISTLLEFGPQEIENHILALTDILADAFKNMDGVKLITPESRNERAGIVTIELLKKSADDVLKTLTDENITISLREGKLRFAPHFYNSPDEVFKALDVFKKAVNF
jgi:selenocysteine lyase/cysteine desulfurase